MGDRENYMCKRKRSTTSDENLKQCSPSAILDIDENLFQIGYPAENLFHIKYSDEDPFLKLPESLLDCPICFRNLTIPVFQCSNGHLVCSSCHVRVKPKCPSCSTDLGHSRNRAIEKVLESSIVSCSYKSFGCAAEFAYSTKQIHEENCSYRPFNCPFKDCDFLGSPVGFCHHLKKDHSKRIIPLKSVPTFRINKDVKFLVLYEEGKDGGMFFLDTAKMRITSLIKDPNLCKAPNFNYDIVAEEYFGSFKFSPVMVPCRCANDAFWNKSLIDDDDDDDDLDTEESEHVLGILDHFFSISGHIMLRITES